MSDYSTYLDNVKKSIRTNILWANSDGRKTDPDEFLDRVIVYCLKLKLNHPEKKSAKTRHGSGRKKEKE